MTVRPIKIKYNLSIIFLTYLNAVMVKILAVLKLAGGVVFVCWQELALVHVVDRRNGQVERETTFFIQAMMNAAEIVNRLDGSDRCHIQGTVGMFHKTCFMMHGVAVQVMVTVSLDRQEERNGFKEYSGEQVHLQSCCRAFFKRPVYMSVCSYSLVLNFCFVSFFSAFIDFVNQLFLFYLRV